MVQDNVGWGFFLEYVDQVDYLIRNGIKKAIKSGKSVPLKDAAVVLSNESMFAMDFGREDYIYDICNKLKKLQSSITCEPKKAWIFLGLP